MKLEYFTSMISKLSSFYDENGYYGFMPSISWDLFPVQNDGEGFSGKIPSSELFNHGFGYSIK